MAELAPKTTLSTRQHIEMEASIHWLMVVAVCEVTRHAMTVVCASAAHRHWRDACVSRAGARVASACGPALAAGWGSGRRVENATRLAARCRCARHADFCASACRRPRALCAGARRPPSRRLVRQLGGRRADAVSSLDDDAIADEEKVDIAVDRE